MISGLAPYGPYETYYEIHGDLHTKTGRPFVLVHGGPGATHHYLESITSLSTNRAVILYDQVGCGNSTRLPDVDSSLWTLDFFLGELDNLLQHLGIAEEYDLLGHSWGGILSAEHAVRRPKGLKHLVLASSPADVNLWDVPRLVKKLPLDSQEVISRYLEPGVRESPEYQAAMGLYTTRFLCRMDPMPDSFLTTGKLTGEDRTVHLAIMGPSDFASPVTGHLKDWSIVDRAHMIAVPTLVTNGVDEGASDVAIAAYVEKIPRSKWVKFEGSSHLPHLEEQERYMKLLEEFLSKD